MDSVFESIFAGIQAFVYRCRNDADYTMVYMAGGVQGLTGYRAEALLENADLSYFALLDQSEVAENVQKVEAAIAAGESWDFAYRLIHRDGHAVSVRERGRAVFEDGALAYLEGLVVDARAEFDLRDRIERRFDATQSASADIVSLTRQITNSVKELSMLSVNARIEAARSGEAGKGFAVVAGEMKTLADRNAAWAEQIATQVQQMGGD